MRHVKERAFHTPPEKHSEGTGTQRGMPRYRFWTEKTRAMSRCPLRTNSPGRLRLHGEHWSEGLDSALVVMTSQAISVSSQRARVSPVQSIGVLLHSPEFVATVMERGSVFRLKSGMLKRAARRRLLSGYHWHILCTTSERHARFMTIAIDAHWAIPRRRHSAPTYSRLVRG
jgi:hypothetical protein